MNIGARKTIASLLALVLLVPAVVTPVLAASCTDGTAGADTLTASTTCTNNLDAGAGNDTVTVNAGVTVSDNVNGDAGDDTITVNGAVKKTVDGGTGNDTIAINGAAEDVKGGDGTDNITVSGVVTKTVDGGKGVDTIIVTSTGSAKDVKGGDDNDIITINGTVTNNVDGEKGNDTITVNGTVTNNVDGGDGDDAITVNSSLTVGGDVKGGKDNDTITISGTVNGKVQGEDGNDTVTLKDGASVAGDIDGGNGTDTLRFEFTSTDAAEVAFFASIFPPTAADGSLTFRSLTYKWKKFESLLNLMTFVGATGGTTDGGGPGYSAIPGLIPVTGGELQPLSAFVNTTLGLPNGDSATFDAGSGDFASVTPISSSGLPLPLPGGASYLSAMNVAVLSGGAALTTLPAGKTLTVSFAIPSGAPGPFRILYFDANANGGLGGWVEVPSAVVGGQVVATVNFTGTFVLVSP